MGQIFAQWANSIGAKVIGTVGSEEKIKIAEENGYSNVINYSKDDFAKKVMEITKTRELLQFLMVWGKIHFINL